MATLLKTKLLVVVLISQVVAGNQTDQLRAICNNKAELSRASELTGLVGVLSSKPEDDVTLCPARTRLVLVELDRLINSDQNVCSSEKAEQIAAYYSKFVDNKSLADLKEHKLPKIIKNLYLSYGFEVSRVCKTLMVSLLLSTTRRLHDEMDLRQMRMWTSDNTQLGKLVKSPRDVDDLLLVSNDFVSQITQGEADESNTGGDHEKVPMVLPSATSEVIKTVQAVCGRRFRPIYRQLILPMVSLSRVGFNWPQVGADLDDIQLWYRIVYLCESVLSVELFEDPEGLVRGDKPAHILTYEEADQLTRVSQPPTTGGDKGNYQLDVRPVRLADLIVDKQDKQMLRMVGNFEANKREQSRVRLQAWRRMLTSTKEFVKNKKVKLSRLFKKDGLDEELVRSIDLDEPIDRKKGHLRWFALCFVTALGYSVASLGG